MLLQRLLISTSTLSLNFSLITALSLSGSNLAAQASNSSSQPIPPKQDPWYTAPAGFENATPGTVLRMRTASGNITTVTGNCSVAYNVLYRTTNSNYEPTFAVTTVFLPLKNLTSPTPLLSYQIPYNTADLNGSPSYILYQGEYPDIGVALGEGWVVSVPDFEGPLASFWMGLTEGHAVLDSIRGVLSQSVFGLSGNSTKIALWGYSGGSIASTFAIELQSQYAPDLSLSGAALGGMVPSLPASAPLINTRPNAGLLPSAYLGITSQSSTARDLLTSTLNPSNSSAFLAVENYPYSELMAHFSGADILQGYFSNFSAFFYSPEIQAIQRDNCHLGYHGIPQMPLFVYKAINDQLAPVAEVDKIVENWCSLGGVDLLYRRNENGDHLAEYYNGVPAAREFLASVLTGNGGLVPRGSGCVLNDVYVDITSAT